MLSTENNFNQQTHSRLSVMVPSFRSPRFGCTNTASESDINALGLKMSTSKMSERRSGEETSRENLLLFCPGGKETSATGEVQPDGDPFLQARSVQSLLRVIIFASGELSDSTPCLILRWTGRWRACRNWVPLVALWQGQWCRRRGRSRSAHRCSMKRDTRSQPHLMRGNARSCPPQRPHRWRRCSR